MQLTSNWGSVGNPHEGNVSHIYTSVVDVKLSQGENLPAYVVCIVNGEAEAIKTLQSKDLTYLRTEATRNTFRTGADNDATQESDGFVMSNSVYYGTNILTGATNESLCATPINANAQLFLTKDDAKNAMDKALADGATAADQAAVVDIYVERVAAKVSLVMPATAYSTPYELTNGDNPEGDNVELSFTPQYWCMNACANDIFLTKRYGLDEAGMNHSPKFSELQYVYADQNGFTDWNDPNNYRSYWGCSPSYFADAYPETSDDVTEAVNPYTTSYLSYNDVVTQSARSSVGKQAIAAVGGAFTATTDGTNASGYIYAKETTTALTTIKNGVNPAAAVASAVLVGRYAPQTGIPTATGGTFYIDFNSGAGNGTYYGVTANVINELVSRQQVIFTRSGDGTQESPYEYKLLKETSAITTNAWGLAHPAQVVRDNYLGKLAGRLVTLQFSNVPGINNTPLYYFNLTANNGEGAYQAINQSNLSDVNAQLASSVGYLSQYGNGHAFFSIPIRHLNWDSETMMSDGKYVWDDMKVGALGVVRNHVYNITVNNISGIGTGLRSDDQPIVPAKDEVNQYIAARLNILAWNVANTWSVDL